jgi:hypothetical protein
VEAVVKIKRMPQAHQLAGATHPGTSHEAAQRIVKGLSHKHESVLYAHRELVACSEAEAYEFLLDEGVAIGHFDNVRKRRGELTNPSRGYVGVPFFMLAEEDEYGRGSSLLGVSGVASRFRLTGKGRRESRAIRLADLLDDSLWTGKGARRLPGDR